MRVLHGANGHFLKIHIEIGSVRQDGERTRFDYIGRDIFHCIFQRLSTVAGESFFFTFPKRQRFRQTFRRNFTFFVQRSDTVRFSYLNVYFKKVSKTTGKETDDSFRLPSATLEQAGLLSAEDKQALENMKSGMPADDVTHPIVIVDEIRPLKNGYYTLETAIASIVSYQQESGVKYERTGLIITYKTGEYEMETRQRSSSEVLQCLLFPRLRRGWPEHRHRRHQLNKPAFCPPRISKPLRI